MLNQFSWSDYAEVMGILIGSYYLLLAATLYRKEIAGLAALKIKTRNENELLNGQGVSFEYLEEIIKDIDSILEMAGTEAGKEQLTQRLKERLASYVWLRHPAYRSAVFSHTIKQVEAICGVRITEQELE